MTRNQNCKKLNADARLVRCRLVVNQFKFGIVGTLYGFGIITTLGYNRIAPATLKGRLCCVVYGLCGIPITLIVIANLGQWANSAATTIRLKVGRRFR